MAESLLLVLLDKETQLRVFQQITGKTHNKTEAQTGVALCESHTVITAESQLL